MSGHPANGPHRSLQDQSESSGGSVGLVVKDHIAWVRLNRPTLANAFDSPMWQSFGAAWTSIARDPQIRVVLLAGEGRHFCAGIDLSMLEGLDRSVRTDEGGGNERREALLQQIRELQAVVTAVAECRVPVIAAISGACVGAGLDIAAACDLRLCSGDAWFSLKEIDVGIPADLGSLQRLQPIIGQGRLKEMAYTARKVSASEAHAWGLVNSVWDTREALLGGATALAEAIAAKAPRAMRGIKSTIDAAAASMTADGLDRVGLLNASILGTKETREALAAVREKRAAKFP